MEKLNKYIYKTSPYQSIDTAHVPADIGSWGGNDKFLAALVRKIRPRVILEIGTWKGASAINMGISAKSCGLYTEIISADPHIGSPGLWLHNPNAMHLNDLGQCGTYMLFLANVKRAGLEGVITPLCVTSSVATSIMKQVGIQADLIYIDGSHDPIDVEADLAHALKVAHDDTVIVCDDYKHPRITGVTEAVSKFLDLHNKFKIAAEHTTPLSHYTEVILGTETGEKAVIVKEGSKFDHTFEI